MKKVLSLVLVLLLVFSLSLSALAANHSIVINHNHAGHHYELYQIFTGDFHEGVLSNIQWGNGIKGDDAAKEALAQAIADKINGSSSATCKTAAEVAVLISGESANKDTVEVKKFAEVLSTKEDGSLKYLTNPNKAFTWNEATGQYTFSDLKPGYYLVKDEDGYKITDGEAATYYILQVSSGEANVNPKNGVPSIVKKVDDINDSDAQNGNQKLVDSADYDIGDDVPFTITASMPTTGVAYYDTYKLAFHDTLSQALELDTTSVRVTFNDTDVTAKFTVTVDKDDSQKFTVSCDNVLAIEGVGDQSQFVLTYTAELTADGVVYGNPGNPNTVYLEYSSDPNYSGTGEENPTSETPEDKVTVFTYFARITKQDGEGEELAGANFKLEKWNRESQENDKYEEIEFSNGEGKLYGYTYNDGTYDYDVIMDSTGKVTSVDKIVVQDKTTTKTALKTEEIEALKLPAKTAADATKFYFYGLDAGHYRLTETQTPAGYNSLPDPIEFVVTANHELESADPKLKEIDVTGTNGAGIANEGAIVTTIMNTKGAVLPSTGGMGTTLLYVFGSIMVLGATVLLVAKKRMGNKG